MKTKKGFWTMLMFVLIGLCFIPRSEVEASMKDEATDYDWGQVYEGYHNYGTHLDKYYKVSLKDESCVYIRVTAKSLNYVRVYDSNGQEIIKSSDFMLANDKTEDTKIMFTSRLLPEGIYYIEFEVRNEWKFFATAEDAIKLEKVKIKKLSTSKGNLTITANTISKDAESLEIQYDTNQNFANAKTVYSEGTEYTINKLEKGKKYYVRVRQKAIYGSGGEVFSAWSPVKSKTIK